MLPVYILSKYNIRLSNGMLYQWLNFTVRSCSSSSDSSDSDSDTEKVKSKRKYDKSASPPTSSNKDNLETFLNNIMQQSVSAKVKDTGPAKDSRMPKDTSPEKVEQKNTKPTANLTEYINNMMKARKLQKTIDVAIQPKKKPDNKLKKDKHISYEKKLISAAEDVANTLGGDKTKTTSDLLEKVLASRVEALKEAQLKNTPLQKDTKSQFRQSPEGNRQDSAKKSIIQTLLDDYNKRPAVENSISQQLLNSVKRSSEQLPDNMKRARTRQDIDMWNGQPSNIFENMGVASPDTPELKTWAALEQRELKALTTHSPANIFQELILWTEQGKLWKFPIDNEQGMEEEHNIHFAEHVFMERHLKGWCPKSGPIRHFMELVCTGLSKNPYLTVKEKIDHIMWYKEYFESKQDLLKELGAIQEPFPDKVKEITE